MSCCNKMGQLLKITNQLGHLSVGNGEISGSVSVNESGVCLDDGWNCIPKIEFNFCPYCGKSLMKEVTK